jgi:membrane protein YqaA with SNARE-associated domain
MEYFTEFGYIGLFFASFLAATIMPLSSEVVLVFLLLKSINPIILISVATFGNVLGSFVNYFIGAWGSMLIIKKFLRISEDNFSRAKLRFKKYGAYSLFFAWVPIIGDPLTVVAGVLKINILLFIALVTSGKLIRYIIIAYATLY